MKLYSNNGKYSAGKKPRRKRKASRVQKVLLVILAVVLAVLLGMLFLLLRGQSAQNDFRKLSAQVQERKATEAPAGTAAPAATEPPGETAPAGTVPETLPTVTEPEVKTILPQYAPLYEQNTDLFGWVTIEDTVIDYPVMHTPDDPEKYLHANFDGEYSYGGVPFIDASCTADSDNLLIYGHNMLNGSMFRSLMKYQEKTYWEKHPTIRFNTLYEEQEYEVLAAFYDRVYYQTETVFKFYQFIDAEDEADFDNAISQFREKALYDTGVEAAYGDQLITLVTCAYHTDNGRFVVVARRK